MAIPRSTEVPPGPWTWQVVRPDPRLDARGVALVAASGGWVISVESGHGRTRLGDVAAGTSEDFGWLDGHDRPVGPIGAAVAAVPELLAIRESHDELVEAVIDLLDEHLPDRHPENCLDAVRLLGRHLESSLTRAVSISDAVTDYAEWLTSRAAMPGERRLSAHEALADIADHCQRTDRAFDELEVRYGRGEECSWEFGFGVLNAWIQPGRMPDRTMPLALIRAAVSAEVDARYPADSPRPELRTVLEGAPRRALAAGDSHVGMEHVRAVLDEP